MDLSLKFAATRSDEGETRGQGDKGTRGQGDKETRGDGEQDAPTAENNYKEYIPN